MGNSKENSFSFWKNIILAIVFFSVTPLTLGASIYSSLPIDFPSISEKVQSSDARPEIIKNYLLRYKSPLVSFAGYIVQAADEFDIDYRLTTAIAQQESNLCKIIPPNTYNCWGWGIHSEGTLGFSSYEEGIRAVT